MAQFPAREGDSTKPWFMSCQSFSVVLVALLALFCVASFRNQVVSLRAEVEALRNTFNEHCSQKFNNDGELFKRQSDSQRVMEYYDVDYDEDDNGDDDDDDVDTNDNDSFLSKVNQHVAATQGGEPKVGNRHGNSYLLWVLTNGIGGPKDRIRRNTGKSKQKNGKNKRKKKRHPVLDVVQFVSTAGPRHPLGIIDDWHYADWSTKKTKKQFRLGLKAPDLGKVEIKFRGLLLAQAQITYTGMKDREFKIVKEESGTEELEIIACCVQAMRLSTVHEDTSSMSTCYTSSVMSVKAGDRVYVTETIAGSGATFEPGYSFLTFIRVG